MHFLSFGLIAKIKVIKHSFCFLVFYGYKTQETIFLNKLMRMKELFMNF